MGRGKRGVALVVLILCVSIISCMKLYAEEKPIRVGYIDYAAYIEKDSDGNYNGYGVEYLNRVAEYTKWDYEFVNDTWKNCLEKLRSGEIDLLCTAQYTDERAKYFDYSEYAIGKESSIIYTSLNNDEIYYNDYAYMNGTKVALLRESYQTDRFDEFAKKHGFTYIPVIFDSETEMIKAIKSGRVDMLVAGSLDLHNDLKVVGEFAIEPFYFITTKGNTELMKSLNEALEEINSVSPYYEMELYQKYYGGSTAATVPSFTRTEAEYINNSKPIEIGLLTNAYPVSSYNKQSGGLVGISEDILQLIAEKSGLQFIYRPIDEQNLQELKNSGLDLYGNFIRTDEIASDANLKITDKYFDTTFTTVGRVGSKLTHRDQISVAMNRAVSPISKELQAEHPNYQIQYYEDYEGCAKALVSGKVDLMLQNVYITSNILRKAQYDNLEIIPALSIQEQLVMVGTAETDDRLISIINKTIEVLDKDDINQIVVDHTIVKNNSLSLFDMMYKYRAAIVLLSILFLCILSVCIIGMQIRRKNYRMLESKNRQLVDAIKQAEHANEAKSIFLSRMSHEIRTPMNAIIGINSLIKKHAAEPARINSYVEKIDMSSHILLNLINDVLDMSAIDQKKLKIANTPFDIQEVVETLEEMYMPICKGKNLDFQIIYGEDIEEIVVGDQLRVNQILLNLLSNAVKFTPAGGKVTLKVEKLSEESNKEYLRFTVADTGIGIAKEQKERLFQPFEQEDGTTARKYGGSGLGLSITKNLVEMMNGAIHVESEKGQGAIFTVELPFEIANEEQIMKETSDEEETEYDLTGCHILLADDNPLNQEIAVELLEAVGAVVDTVENGKDAVEKFQNSEQGTYDVILMDIQMPIMDGYEAAVTIRHSEHPQAKEIPILAMTANAFTEDVTAALAAGMNAHIAKPIDTNVLYKKIKEYVFI